MLLSNREARTIGCLASGLQSKEISTVLGVSVPTVELEIRRLYEKFSARTRAELVARAFVQGVLPLGEEFVAQRIR